MTYDADLELKPELIQAKNFTGAHATRKRREALSLRVNLKNREGVGALVGI